MGSRNAKHPAASSATGCPVTLLPAPSGGRSGASGPSCGLRATGRGPVGRSPCSCGVRRQGTPSIGDAASAPCRTSPTSPALGLKSGAGQEIHGATVPFVQSMMSRFVFGSPGIFLSLRLTLLDWTKTFRSLLWPAFAVTAPIRRPSGPTLSSPKTRRRASGPV